MEDVFGKLRIQLELLDWPNVYLFKFIVPNDSERIAKVSALFTESAELTMHPSRNGNYMSISVKEMMLDVDSIIEKYEKSAEIKGVITL
jgi:putative lipoic acid-binding regulatory protein